jgi:hypothetical protein
MVIEFDFEIYKTEIMIRYISATGKRQEYYVIMGRAIAL